MKMAGVKKRRIKRQGVKKRGVERRTPSYMWSN